MCCIFFLFIWPCLKSDKLLAGFLWGWLYSCLASFLFPSSLTSFFVTAEIKHLIVPSPSCCIVLCLVFTKHGINIKTLNFGLSRAELPHLHLMCQLPGYIQKDEIKNKKIVKNLTMPNKIFCMCYDHVFGDCCTELTLACTNYRAGKCITVSKVNTILLWLELKLLTQPTDINSIIQHIPATVCHSFDSIIY